MDEKKTRVYVRTADDYLFRKIALSLPKSEVLPYGGERDGILLFDLDDGEAAPAGALTMSRSTACDISLPFPLLGLEDLIKRDTGCRLSLSPAEKCAILDGRGIPLSEVEYALLERLLLGGGESVSREEIADAVWSGEKRDGLINVYIHYLREKLEASGEKVILAERGGGYRVDKKFIERRPLC